MHDHLLEVLRESLKGRFEIAREIGRGVYGSVFDATDANARRVALKVLRPDIVVAGQHKRVLRELGIISRLSHPHILPVLESGTAEDSLFYSMPFLSGPSLADRLDRDGPLDLNEAHRLATAVGEALEYAHRHGVVHRDVAPRHILFDGDNAVVKEFWIARALSSSLNDRLTSAGMIVGTPGYMSPEQLNGAKVDQRSDVYSLAVLIVRMLTNDIPFKDDTIARIIRHQFEADGRSLANLPKGLDANVARAVVKALAADPDKRFASARELVEACFEGTSDTGSFVAMMMEPGVRRGPGEVDEPDAREFGRSRLTATGFAPALRRAARAPRRTPAVPIVFAAALLLVVSIGGYFGFSGLWAPALLSLGVAILLGAGIRHRRAQPAAGKHAVAGVTPKHSIRDDTGDDETFREESPPQRRRAHAPRVLPIDRLRAALRFQYDIEREVARGGMAEVYLAKDMRYRGRVVALKVLRAEYAASGTSERFLEEIEITARLSHPGILPLLDSGDADGRPFYVMPYVEGRTLRSRMDDQTRLSVVDALNVTREVARALEYAHRCQVIHRDIKPENILLHEGQATVMDFGIALALDRARDRRLTAGLSIGTPEYMSPEQFWDTQNIDHRSDIYSLGCVLHEMLAGVPPYTGSPTQLSVKHLEAPIPLIRLVRPEAPEAVEAALLKCLAKNRKDRFDNAVMLAAALSTPGAPAAVAAPTRPVSA